MFVKNMKENIHLMQRTLHIMNELYIYIVVKSSFMIFTSISKVLLSQEYWIIHHNYVTNSSNKTINFAV